MGCCSSKPVDPPPTHQAQNNSLHPLPVIASNSAQVSAPAQNQKSVLSPAPVSSSAPIQEKVPSPAPVSVPVPAPVSDPDPSDNTNSIIPGNISPVKPNDYNSNSSLDPVLIENKDENKDEDKEESKFSNDIDLQQSCNGEHNYYFMQTLAKWFADSKGLHPSSPIHIPCSVCQKTFSKPGWLCKVCESIACESCHSEQRNLLLCRKNHVLEWAVDSWALNIELNKSTKSLFACNGCRKSYQEPAYVCRECQFYLCIACSRNKGVTPPIDLLLCSQSHPLLLVPSKGLEIKCSGCESALSGNCYKCSECDFALCQLCGIRKTLKMAKHPGLRCKEGHETMGLNDFRKMDNSHKYRCLGCYKGGMKFGMFCVYCGEVYCLQCATKLQKCIEEAVGKRTPNGGMIEWYGMTSFDERGKDGERDMFSCSMCVEDKMKMGIYFYDREERYCMDCVLSLN